MQFRVQALVIRSMDYGEGNKILTLFTREYGKMSVVARGAKKVKSRYGSVAQLFTCGDYLFFRSGQLGTLNHAEIVEPFYKLREDLYKAAHASYLSELTDRMLGDQEGQPFLFEQLKASFQAIQEDKDFEIVDHLYEMKMIAHAGYSPELTACVSCGADDSLVSFSASMGGALCRRCAAKDSAAIAVSPGLLKLLRVCLQTDVRRLGQIDVKPETKAALKTLITAYFDHHVGLKLKSRDFLEQMDRYGI